MLCTIVLLCTYIQLYHGKRPGVNRILLELANDSAKKQRGQVQEVQAALPSFIRQALVGQTEEGTGLREMRL